MDAGYISQTSSNFYYYVTVSRRMERQGKGEWDLHSEFNHTERGTENKHALFLCDSS